MPNVRRRDQTGSKKQQVRKKMEPDYDEHDSPLPLASNDATAQQAAARRLSLPVGNDTDDARRRQRKTGSAPRWLTLAIASGAFAALNGVFAKLTTASHTHSFAVAVAHLFGAEESSFVEVVVRAACFGLNIISNAIMWMLFTAALTAASSTTRVSILNTSANFIVTALLGMLIFREELPLLWWLGASFLVAGSVVIGAREGSAQESKDNDEGRIALSGEGEAQGEHVAAILGAGGVVENTLAEGRYRDEDLDSRSSLERPLTK